MKYSKTAEQVASRFEGCRLKAYQDLGGVWTIGFGHTLNVCEGMTITLAQAYKFLEDDLNTAAYFVNKLVTVQLTQGEFDALTDFVFNLGPINFQRSTLHELINKRQFQAAAKEFEKWDHVGGKVVAGLLSRRKAEEELFTDGSVQNS